MSPTTPTTPAAGGPSGERLAESIASLGEAIADRIAHPAPSLAHEVLVGMVEIQGSVLDLLAYDPSPAHRSAAKLVQEAIAEVLSGITHRHCHVCGCSEEDCSRCMERTGEPCVWVEPDLCSACAPARDPVQEYRSRIERETLTTGEVDRRLFRECLHAAAPQIFHVAKVLRSYRTLSVFHFDDLAARLEGVMTHRGWFAAGLSFPTGGEPSQPAAARNGERS
jgi:hypothetical protein